MAITVIRECDDNSSCCALYAEKTYFLSRYWPIQHKILYSSIHIKWKLKRHPLDMSFGSFHFAEACGITNIKITLVLQLIIRRFLINVTITCFYSQRLRVKGVSTYALSDVGNLNSTTWKIQEPLQYCQALYRATFNDLDLLTFDDLLNLQKSNPLNSFSRLNWETRRDSWNIEQY